MNTTKRNKLRNELEKIAENTPMAISCKKDNKQYTMIGFFHFGMNGSSITLKNTYTSPYGGMLDTTDDYNGVNIPLENIEDYKILKEKK